MARKRIGELLVERGAISPAQLEEGLAHHRQTRQRLGTALIQKGFITEGQLVQVLGEALGLPVVDLKGQTPDWAAVHMLRARFCDQHELFPYGLEAHGGRKTLLVAMSDPLNMPALEEIEFTTGLKVEPRLALPSAVRASILRYYHKVDPDSAGAGQFVQAGGAALPGRDRAPERAGEDEEVIEGELVEAADPLADLIQQHEGRRKHPRKARTPVDSLSQDLDYLIGAAADPDPVEQLEKKFWTLMRLMARKGLISKDEFAEALAESEND